MFVRDEILEAGKLREKEHSHRHSRGTICQIRAWDSQQHAKSRFSLISLSRTFYPFGQQPAIVPERFPARIPVALLHIPLDFHSLVFAVFHRKCFRWRVNFVNFKFIDVTKLRKIFAHVRFNGWKRWYNWWSDTSEMIECNEFPEPLRTTTKMNPKDFSDPFYLLSIISLLARCFASISFTLLPVLPFTANAIVRVTKKSGRIRGRFGAYCANCCSRSFEG